MSLNILAELEGLISDGSRFDAAVFLTYSLNLQFFEQLVQPKLDALGCTHVVIISDVFGYQEALERNLRHITGVGRRYVCTPLEASGRGVQHGKIMMLVSENRGWMLMGSGNLTFHGYGQNLEFFDLVKYDETRPDSSDTNTFQSIWNLIQQLQSSLSRTAQEQLRHIHKIASWLGKPLPSSQKLSVWHSFNRPLIENIAGLGPVNELLLMAPFIQLEAVQQLIEHLSPSKLIVGVDSSCPNVDGKSLESLCHSLGCDLEIRAIHPLDSKSKRGLHAKAIAGVNDNGSWCIAGSANITRPALMDHWNSQGNLEIAVYRDTHNLNLLDLLEGNGVVTSTKLSTQDTVIEFEEPLGSTQQEVFGLSSVVARDGNIMGQVYFREELAIRELRLRLVLSDTILIISLDSQNHFSLPLTTRLSGSEVAFVEALLDDDTFKRSTLVVVDQPNELDKYSARSFHRSMRGKLELVQDAAHTFKELMEFLFQRTDRNRLKLEDITQQRRSDQRKNKTESSYKDELDVLPIDAFLTDEELSYKVGRHIDMLNPYERDHYSLRDLLSLALLRVTTETTPARTSAASFDNEEDEQAIYTEIENIRQTQRTWQEWLVNFLVGYCKRYHHRLLDNEFLFNTDLLLVFQNHHTLSRAILEFHEKTEILSSSRLREIVRQIWSPMFSRPGVLDSVVDRAFHTEWVEESLSELFVSMIAAAWDDPIPQSISDIATIKKFLYVKRLIARAEVYLGSQFWHGNRVTVSDGLVDTNFGFHQISIETVNRFEELANFKTPTEKRYEPCIRLLQLKTTSEWHTQEAVQLQSYLKENEPRAYELIKRATRISALVGDRRECPMSFIELSELDLMRLRRGDLVESPHTPRLLLYWTPDINEESVIL